MTISIRNLKKMLLLFVLCIFSAILQNFTLNIEVLNVYILINISTVIGVFYDKKNKINLLFIFMVLLALFHFGQTFLNVFSINVTTSNAYDLYAMYSDEEMKSTLSFCLVGYNLIALVAQFTKAISMRSCLADSYSVKSERDDYANGSEVYEFGKILFWILLIPIIAFDITISVSGLAIGYMARYTYPYPVLSDLDLYFPMAIICILVGGNEKRHWKGYYIFALARITLQMITVGNRSALIIYLILYELTRNNCHRDKKKRSRFGTIIYLLAIVAVCIMISFVAIIRGGNRITIETFFDEYNVFSLFFSEFGSTLITPILASDYIEKFGVLLGKNYLGALAVLIPFSSHFMSGIRSYMNVGALLNPYSPLKGALGGSLFADMILSLGNWGLLVAVPLGVIVAKLSHRITYSKSVDFWKCTTIYFSYSILLYVRGTAEDLALTGKRTIYLIILYIVFLNLRNRRKYEGNY